MDALTRARDIEAFERPSVDVIQDGARLHYALPVALQRAGILNRAFTDWFVHPGSLAERLSHLARLAWPGAARGAAERRCAELPPERMLASLWLSLRRQLTMRFGDISTEERFARCSRQAARWYWRRRGGANALMGFVRSIDPQLCEAARDEGMIVVVDQMIAPADEQWAAECRQAERWPQWRESRPVWDVALVRALEHRTWAAAHHITCPSEYVRDALLARGVPASKVSVLPYPIDSAAYPFFDRRGRTQAPVVGFVGAVGLRKGAPDVIAVARSFEQRGVRFVLVGPAAGEFADSVGAGGNVELTGALPRSAVRGWLERFDVFFLPSTCEGSAGAAMEAMATGLPVVTTPNAGTVVRDGIDGFVLPCGQLPRFVAALQRLLDDPQRRLQMGEAACRRVSAFDLDYYAGALHTLFSDLTKSRGRRPHRGH